MTQLIELKAICEQYEDKIPISVAAKWLGMNEDGLKASLMSGTCPFGFGYQKDRNGYRQFVIPTLTFWLWATNGKIYLKENENATLEM